MVATLHNTNHFKSCGHTEAEDDAQIHKLNTQALSAWQLFYLWFAFSTKTQTFKCSERYHPAITIWLETNK